MIEHFRLEMGITTDGDGDPIEDQAVIFIEGMDPSFQISVEAQCANVIAQRIVTLWNAAGEVSHQQTADRDLHEYCAKIEAKLMAAEARINRLTDALKSISANTCCANCREAALVARSALARYVGMKFRELAEQNKGAGK